MCVKVSNFLKYFFVSLNIISNSNSRLHLIVFIIVLCQIDLISQKFSMYTSEQNHNHWTVENTGDSKLVNTKQDTHIGDKLMELHLLETEWKYSLGWIVINYHKYQIYQMVSAEQWMYEAKE